MVGWARLVFTADFRAPPPAAQKSGAVDLTGRLARYGGFPDTPRADVPHNPGASMPDPPGVAGACLRIKLERLQ